jgi:phosphate transport system protein
MHEHILSSFENALRSLRGEVLAMASIARRNLENAARGLAGRDVELCRSVIADDTEVDEFERKIDHLGMEILVRFNPVASDLRLVITAMKMSTNLERISDHAVNIAKRARKIAAREELPESQLVEPLHALADGLLRDAVAAFTDRDSALGASLKERDKELDRLHKRLIASLSSRLEEAHGRSEDFLHLIFIARSLERVGDLAVNIGEEAVFLDSARDIRHEKRLQPPPAEPAPEPPPEAGA